MAGRHTEDVPTCPNCHSKAQVWKNQITGLLQCHRAWCDTTIPTQQPETDMSSEPTPVVTFTPKELDTMWQQAMLDSIQADEAFTRYRFADRVLKEAALRQGNTGFYKTGPGESIQGIAQRQLGDERRWREISDLNRDRFGDRLPGDNYPVRSILVMPAK